MLADVKKYRTQKSDVNRRCPATLGELIPAFALLFLYACGGGSISEPEPENSTDPAPPPVQVAGDQSGQTSEVAPETGHGHTDTEERTIQYTDSNQDIWPPQPLGISNVSALTIKQLKRSKPGMGQLTDRIRKAQSTIPAAIPELAGMRHEILTRHDQKDESGQITGIDVQVFNYDTNQLVTVAFNADGTNIVQHSAKAANIYQPPESQAEVARAITLAAQDLSRQGYTEHKNLTGAGLLAFPTLVQSAESGANFFSERKIYVTFGIGNGNLPDYRALVNLSTDSVESSGSIQ